MRGTPSPIRTGDTQVRSLVLYPAELWVHSCKPAVLVATCNLAIGLQTFYKPIKSEK